MKKRKICLFTAHSPLTGGGGAILRSLIPNLTDFDIKWHYTGNKPESGYEDGWLGDSVMGGSFVKDVWQTWKMLSDKNVPAIDHLTTRLKEIECDVYWIISHNEGISLALELSRQQDRPVHMTVHDDWAGALCARSVRYRFVGRKANELTIKALKKVTSVDVISNGMQSYYRQLSGIKSFVCHRYLPVESINYDAALYQNKGDEIIAGHIGSVYDRDDFISFVSVFSLFAKSKGRQPVVKMWGCHLTENDLPQDLKEYVSFYDTLPEKEILPQLSECDFLYAMYPLKKSLHVFSKTSLPTKLSSYLQAGRPILGHGPADSTLAEYVNTTHLGTIWSSTKKAAGFDALEELLKLTIMQRQLEIARKKYFGENNLVLLKDAFNRI